MGRTPPAVRSPGMRLWLDDIRNPAWNYEPRIFAWAKTYEEAITLLETGGVTYASLDHDLGPGKSGYDVVCWMEEHDVWPVDGVEAHSMNPVGRERMQVVIDKAYGRGR